MLSDAEFFQPSGPTGRRPQCRAPARLEARDGGPRGVALRQHQARLPGAHGDAALEPDLPADLQGEAPGQMDLIPSRVDTKVAALVWKCVKHCAPLLRKGCAGGPA